MTIIKSMVQGEADSCRLTPLLTHKSVLKSRHKTHREGENTPVTN